MPSPPVRGTTAEPNEGLHLPRIPQRIQVSTTQFIPQVTGLSSLHKRRGAQTDGVVGNVANTAAISLMNMGAVFASGGQ